MNEYAAAELLDHLTQIAREFSPFSTATTYRFTRPMRRRISRHVEAVERHPHVFPRVFAVRGVQRALPGADQKTGARVARIRLPADPYVPLDRKSHSAADTGCARPAPEVPAFAFLIAAVIDGHGAAVVQVFSAVLDGVHVLPPAFFPVYHTSGKIQQNNNFPKQSY